MVRGAMLATLLLGGGCTKDQPAPQAPVSNVAPEPSSAPARARMLATPRRARHVRSVTAPRDRSWKRKRAWRLSSASSTRCVSPRTAPTRTSRPRNRRLTATPRMRGSPTSPDSGPSSSNAPAKRRPTCPSPSAERAERLTRRASITRSPRAAASSLPHRPSEAILAPTQLRNRLADPVSFGHGSRAGTRFGRRFTGRAPHDRGAAHRRRAQRDPHA